MHQRGKRKKKNKKSTIVGFVKYLFTFHSAAKKGEDVLTNVKVENKIKK